MSNRLRRGNKSNKVPNVKLRPPQPSYKPRHLSPTGENNWWVEDSQSSTLDGQSTIGNCPRPFKGTILCATGIGDKSVLFKKALELGAICVSAFTDRVTHLVAIDHGGAKYMCAVERRVPIMLPSWVTESYETWLRGDDVDLQESMESHRLPVFSGVILTLSGVDDIIRRTQISKLLSQQGGVYVKNLERPVKVTHLLCSGETDTDKIHYAEKFNQRGEANIHLIWEEWFWDSLEFGGRFDESKYQVRKPRPQRRSAPEPEMRESSSPTHENPPPSSSPAPDMDVRSSPPPANHEDGLDEEVVSVKRVPSVTLHVWQGLLKTRGFEIAGDKLIRSPEKARAAATRAIPTTKHPTLPYMEENDISTPEPTSGGVVSSLRRANSFAPLPTNASVPRQPFRRETVPMPTPALFPEAEVEGESSSMGAAGLFSGLRFRALGEARGANVRTAVERCGGIMVSGEEEEVEYIIVRLVSGSKYYKEESDIVERAKYRTECWLERCVFEERICAPDEHISFLPLKINIPVAGSEKINLSYSGLDESEACWVRRLIRALGINLAVNFSRRSTHLLCPSRTGTKNDKALEWGIPVVDMEWLAAIATGGPKCSPPGESIEDMYGEEEPALQPPLPASPKNSKGKGKEKENPPPSQIIDLTDGVQSSSERPHISQLRQQPNEQGGSQSDYALFGLPTGSLAVPMTPPRRRYTPTPAPAISSLLSAVQAAPSTDAFREETGLARRMTPREIKHDMATTCIPSSNSPSPMKIPDSSSVLDAVVETPSPVRVSTVANVDEATKALQESITSLLGKRPSTEDEGGGAGAQQQGKAGKRARPLPRRVASRKTSAEETAGGVQVTLPPFEPYGDALNPFKGGIFEGEEVPGEEYPQAVDTMRVVYEDPGQRDEKQRLMRLFNSPGLQVSAPPTRPPPPKSGRKLVRRSTRVAGF